MTDEWKRGREKGIIDQKQNTAQRMLCIFSLDKIAELTGLHIRQVKRLETRLYAESREKARINKAIMMYSERKKGREEGREEARKEARKKERKEVSREVARKMLAVNMSLNKIAEITGLDIREVEELD